VSDVLRQPIESGREMESEIRRRQINKENSFMVDQFPPTQASDWCAVEVATLHLAFPRILRHVFDLIEAMCSS
jgi:hypothetical protein